MALFAEPAGNFYISIWDVVWTLEGMICLSVLLIPVAITAHCLLARHNAPEQPLAVPKETDQQRGRLE
jgi:hypothetical protein